MSTPLVSITSAFYNEESNLLDMVKSIFAQTFTDWELILLDDGSTDNSLEIAQSINEPRVKVYSNGVNKGRSYSLNRLTELSSGKYIARMDADDMSSATRIQKQVECLEAHGDCDAVGTGICYLDNKDNPVGIGLMPVEHSIICQSPEKGINICHGSILGEKEWFKKNSYDNSIQYAVDYNFLLRAYKNTKFINVPEALYYYRLDNSFNLKKQYITRKTSAHFLYEYFKKEDKYITALMSSAGQYVKYGITLAMFNLGQREKLLKRRYQDLGRSEKRFYVNEIVNIRQTKLHIKVKK